MDGLDGRIRKYERPQDEHGDYQTDLSPNPEATTEHKSRMPPFYIAGIA